MIQCRYEKSKGKHHLEFLGHAGYDDEGRDIVCAAVSAIFYSLLGAVLTYSKKGVDFEDNSGEGKITFKDTRRNRDFLSMAICGLSQIAELYPEYLKVFLK